MLAVRVTKSVLRTLTNFNHTHYEHWNTSWLFLNLNYIVKLAASETWIPLAVENLRISDLFNIILEFLSRQRQYQKSHRPDIDWLNTEIQTGFANSTTKNRVISSITLPLIPTEGRIYSRVCGWMYMPPSSYTCQFETVKGLMSSNQLSSISNEAGFRNFRNRFSWLARITLYRVIRSFDSCMKNIKT